MSYDPRHVRKANRTLALKREEDELKRVQLEASLRVKLPRLAELDRAIRRSVTEAIAVALQTGNDPAGAVESIRRANLSMQQERLELLRANGIDPERLEPSNGCDLCGGSGWKQGKLCSCVTDLCREENRKELTEQLDLDRLNFERFSLEWYADSFQPALGGSERELMGIVRDTCAGYARSFPRGDMANLFLYGGTGLGKTFLSGCIAEQVVKKGYWVVYVTAGALFSAYERVKFGRDPEGTLEDDLDRYEKCDLLILDDLGSEMTTPLVHAALYELLNQRLVPSRHTVISSNLSMDDVRARYTAQVASRLEGEFKEVPFFGEDIRLKKKAKSQGF